jgi:uncharacterized coiled-coil DUF342 family protein
MNKLEQLLSELQQYKAAAYDMYKEINRLTGLLQQYNAAIEQHNKEIMELQTAPAVASEAPAKKKPAK